MLRIKGFLPFLLIAFLNASVDMGHKIIIQNTVFKIYNGAEQVILTAIVNSLILLPFVLLFTPAGWLADRFYKPHIMRWAARVAVGLTLMITLSYYMGWFYFAFLMTFLLAAQSALYSPAKYGYIIELVGDNKLTFANGIVQAVSIVAILGGMLLFSVLFESMLAGQTYLMTESNIIKLIAPLGWLLVAGSLIELILTHQLPARSERGIPVKTPFDWPRYRRGALLRRNLGALRQNPLIWLCIMGLSVFWGGSQAVLATFPAFAKSTLVIDNTVVIQALLACSGIGIIIGSLAAGFISRHGVHTWLVPVGGLGMMTSLFLLPQGHSNIILGLSILSFGMFGGLFIVPLNSLIQHHAPNAKRGTILAGNNWIQNCVMIGFLMLMVVLSFQQVDSVVLLYLISGLCAIALGFLFSKWRKISPDA